MANCNTEKDYDGYYELPEPGARLGSCVGLYTGLDLCYSVDAANLSVAIDIKVFGVRVEHGEIGIGKPFTTTVGVGPATAKITISVVKEGNKHCLNIQYNVHLPFLGNVAHGNKDVVCF
ncbi:hypothetical protein ABE42_41670 [Bacillus thuringiensis]|nr:hypothetical protein [Bacillus thuringiensis]QBS13628.1 Cry76Aa [Bacillus thuringiensis]